jgi:hypothetical protein
VYCNSGILSSMDAVKRKEQKRALATRPSGHLLIFNLEAAALSRDIRDSAAASLLLLQVVT